METVEIFPAEAAPAKHVKGLMLRRWQRVILCLVCGILILWTGLQLWMLTAEQNLRYTPAYPRQDLSGILQQTALDAGDYRTLYLQTGLGKPAVDILRKKGTAADFEKLQEHFFTKPNIFCDKNTPVSAEERVADEAGNKIPGTRLVGLEEGDILVTSSCHTFGWRNGHAAIVVDAQNGIALESVVMGQNSSLQKISKWECFPTFMVLRLKNASKAERAQIANQAVNTLNDIPYGVTVGLLSDKYAEGKTVTDTQCAHLVWCAYRAHGYDLDSNGGPIVTPRDLANSPLLEVCQIYGMDPDRLWE